MAPGGVSTSGMTPPGVVAPSSTVSVTTIKAVIFEVEQQSECDILVSKLLSFETFPIVLMVLVSKNFGIEKIIGILVN